MYATKVEEYLQMMERSGGRERQRMMGEVLYEDEGECS